MSFHSAKSEEKAFLFGVTIEMPLRRKTGYELANFGSDVLSTSTERPGVEERYEASSSTDNEAVLVTDGVDNAASQPPVAMGGEYAGAGERRVCVDRARRTSCGALGR